MPFDRWCLGLEQEIALTNVISLPVVVSKILAE